MSRTAAPPPIHVRELDALPEVWDALLRSSGDHEVSHRRDWLELAARHYRQAGLRVLLAEYAGEMAGGLAAVARRRHGLTRLESSYDGVPGGPLLSGDLPRDLRGPVSAALCRAYARTVRGRTVLAAQTLADPDLPAAPPAGAGPWRIEGYTSSVVDCRGGLAHVERDLWTNNRRNERNRGLKRGCTLAAETDPAVLDEWYPLYRRSAAAWAQSPVPAALVDAALRRAPGLFLLTTCRRDGELIGGHLCYRTRGRLVAWQSGVRADLLREVFTTTLLYWQAVVVACHEGLAAVDFGGSVGRDSLADFKRRCGAAPEPRQLWTVHAPLGRLARTAGRAWRRIRERRR